MEELERQAGILGKTVRNNAQLANAIVNGSFHNGTFSDRIWQYQDLMREDLGKLLQQGLIQGKNPRAIAKDLRKYWYGNDPKTGGGAKYCMERLMRTELARVQTEAQKQSFIRNGYDHYEFIVNSKCCDICAALNEKHFKVANMMPGENAPPMHPNCRCSTAAWVDDEETEAWLDYLENGGTTEEWNKLKANAQKFTLDKATQSSILKLGDIQIGRSVGAKAKNYEIMDLATGEKFRLVEGSRLQNVEVFAGKGSSSVYNKAYKYANRIGGKVEDWQHVKGFGWVETKDGDRFAELHWSQCKGLGKHDFFVKRWLDDES